LKVKDTFNALVGAVRNGGGISLAGFALAASVGSIVLLSGFAEILGLLISLTVMAVLALQAVLRWRARRVVDPALKPVLAFLLDDPVPAFAMDADQVVFWTNTTADAAYPDLKDVGAARALKQLSPEIAPVLRRLRRAADRGGQAEERLVTRHGQVRLAMRSYPPGVQLLRIEPVMTQSDGSLLSGPVPVLSVSRSGTILAMNEALRLQLGRRARRLEDVFAVPPGASDVSAVIMAEAGQTPVLLHQKALSAGRREIAIVPAPGAAGSVNLEGLETLPVAVLKLSPEGAILDSNEAARHLLDIDGKGRAPNFADLVTGLGRSVSQWLDDAFQAHHPLQPEVMRLKDTARENYLQVSLNRTKGGSGAALMAVLHDATELKTLEAQFVQSQKMQAIGQLAGGVAHDFNNLLTAISGHCDLLLLRHHQGDPDYGDLLQINQNANRAASLVGQLLAFSRKQTLQPEVFDICDTLSDLTHLLNRLVGEKVQLTLLNEADLAHLRADKRQLEQVLMNLVVNARDAMPDGGEIVVETKAVNLASPVSRAQVTLPAGEYICLTVTDQGVGIPKDKIGKIFEPFYTTKRTGEGTGLGLSTAYGIVKQSGGFIFAESVPGKGTAFELYFPAHHAIAASSEPAPVFEDVRSDTAGEGIILLVEDEAPVRAFAARALRLNGFTVLEAENGEMALHMLENPSLAVDLFVTDVVMPGLDGPTWVREALVRRGGTPVVFMSGYAEDLLPGANADIPRSTFLQKPFSLKQLTATVHGRVDASSLPKCADVSSASEVA
jgi:two-component system cell cycle sensor histidine kinase/response regulator CckA